MDLICSNCGADVRDGAVVCAGCGYEIAPPKVHRPKTEPAEQNVLSVRVLANVLLRFIVLLFSIAFFGYIIYVAYFWFDSWRIERIYSSGTLREPVIVPIEMTYGQKGHSLTFFGSDGDQLFIPELNRTYPFVGGFTQIDIQDGSWFDLSPEGEESALITLSPVILTEGNGRIALPAVDMEIDTPVSPLEMVDPVSDRIEVDTKMYLMQIKVVPGSQVLINGEDRSGSIATEDGLLQANLNVYPTGDNPISINVSTPHHRSIRRDIVLYRAPQTIQIERDMDLVKSTTQKTATISGQTEPGADIIVDTKYVENSLVVEPSGRFKFKAELSIVGDNTITWHATLAGRDDQYASYTVYYVPTLNEYSRKTWSMNDVRNYEEATRWPELREGQEYQCVGPVVEVFVKEGVEFFVMDVTPEGAEQSTYCILENKTAAKNIEVGKRYKALGDGNGRDFYGDNQCPVLICRYLLEN